MKKLNRAFSTLTCMDAGIDEILDHAKISDIRAVEIRLDKQNNICGYGVEGADTVRARFKEAGCVITDLATSVSVKEENENALNTACRCIDLAAAVGAKAIRIFVGGSIKTFDDVPVHDLEGAAKTVAAMCAYAKPLGIEIWAETHNVLSSAKALCAFCDTVGAGNLKVLWDVLHSIEFNEPIEESARIIGDRLAHIHIKDARPPEDLNLTQYIHTALGDGTFPLTELVKLLKRIGYSGYVSLEYELAWRKELAGLYPDTKAILSAYNSWLDGAEQA